MANSSGHVVFTYGSIQTDEVQRILFNRNPKSAPAILDGYHRFRNKEKIYPCILPAEGDKVSGKLLMDLSDKELYISDQLHPEYDRKTVEVCLVESCEKLQAQTYIWSNKDDPNLYGDWDFEEWKEKHWEQFLKNIHSFMETGKLPQTKP